MACNNNTDLLFSLIGLGLSLTVIGVINGAKKQTKENYVPLQDVPVRPPNKYAIPKTNIAFHQIPPHIPPSFQSPQVLENGFVGLNTYTLQDPIDPKHYDYLVSTPTTKATAAVPSVNGDQCSVNDNNCCQVNSIIRNAPRSNAAREFEKEQNQYFNAADMLPTDDDGHSLDLRHQQNIVYDRMIYTSKRSRLRSLSDPIRGDLPIVPILPDKDNKDIWFRPSVTPHLDLNHGAMNVLTDSDSSHQLNALMHASKRGTLKQNMSVV